MALLMTAAGFINSLAGGGGIITVPAYLAFGLNPALLLGTNKLSASMGAAMSAYKLRHHLKVSKKLVRVLVYHAMFFSVLGAVLSRLINPQNLKFLVLILIPFVAYFVLANKDLGRTETRRQIGVKKSNRAAQFTAGFAAAYDGFFGPGAGTIYAVFLVKYAGFELVQATAMAKLLNFCSNILALIFFLLIGSVNIKLGLAMGAFNILGSWLGVSVGKRRGAAIIRPMIIIVCGAIFIKFFIEVFL